MIADDVKYALQKYNDLKHWVEHANNQIEVIQTKMEKTGGSIIKKPEGSFNRDRFMLSAIEKKDRIFKRIETYNYYYSIANEFMMWCDNDVQSMVVDKYVKGMTYEDLSEKYCYSQRHISRLINKAIDDYIEAT